MDIAADVLSDTGGVVGEVLKFTGTAYRGVVPAKYGDGSDSAIVYSGPVTLSRDVNATTVTFSAGAAVNTRGCYLLATIHVDYTAIPSGGLFCQSLTSDGSNTHNGNNAVANVAGASKSAANGPAWRNAGPAAAGAAGATNAGIASPTGALTVAVSYAGGLYAPGGASGSGSTGAGGAAAGAPLVLAPRNIPRHGEYQHELIGGWVSPPGPSGGGDGTASASGAGGGGALGGPTIQVFAPKIIRSASNPNTACIVARGGNGGSGGTPAAGNRGGGAGAPGAGGGCVRHVCEELSGTVHVGIIDVTGGNGGNSGAGTGTGTAGTGAPAGFGGTAILFCQTALPAVFTDKTAVGGNAGVGTAGGIATTALCDL